MLRAILARTIMAAPRIEKEMTPSSLLERDGLRVTRERVKIESLILPDTLKDRYPTEYDPANIQELATTIKSGILTSHALAVKEVRDNDTSSNLELLHKPSVIFALQKCGISEVDVVVIHNNDDFDIVTASDNQLLFLGEQGVLTNHVVRNIPMADVLSDESIIDDPYRDVLKSQLSTGQEVNIRVRARREGERIVYDIIDGYHRHDSLRIIGSQFISARLTFGMTNEELHDERVLAAFRSAKSVKFARMVTSMQNSYAESVWSKVYNLKLSQILSLAVNANKIKQPGKNLGIPESAAREAIEWVSKKAVLWNSDVGTLCQQIRAAEDSFTEIIKQIRTTEGGGHAGDGVLNRDKFIAMVEQLGKKLSLQSTMVSIIKKHNLNADQTRVIAGALALIEGHPDLIRLVETNPFDTEILSSIYKRKVVIEKGRFVVQEIRRSSRDPGIVEEDVTVESEEPLTSELDDLAPIEEVIKEAESSTIFEAPSEVTPPGSLDAGAQSVIIPAGSNPAKATSFGVSVDKGDHDDYNVKRSVADLERENGELREKLEQANEQLERGGKRKKSSWYETLATLPTQEREIMRYMYKLKEKGCGVAEIDAKTRNEFQLLPNQLSQKKRSALQRLSNYYSDILQKEVDFFTI